MTTNLEKRVREAFESLSPSPELNERTLASIEDARRAEHSPKDGSLLTFVRTAVAACLVLAFLGAGALGYRSVTTPTAYIDIDLNPSVELEVNRFDRVVGSSALNEDGAAVLEGLELFGMPVDEALEQVTGSDQFEAYVGDDGFVSITVACDNGAQRDRLAAFGESCALGLAYEGACFTVDEEDWVAAQEAGMGMGRYLTALELMALDPTMTLEACSEMSMRELHDRIAAYQGAEPTGGGCGFGADGGGRRHRTGR